MRAGTARGGDQKERLRAPGSGRTRTDAVTCSDGDEKVYLRAVGMASKAQEGAGRSEVADAAGAMSAVAGMGFGRRTVVVEKKCVSSPTNATMNIRDFFPRPG